MDLRPDSQRVTGQSLWESLVLRRVRTSSRYLFVRPVLALLSVVLVPWVQGCSDPVELAEQQRSVFFIMNGPDAVAAPGETIPLEAAIRNPLPSPVRGGVTWTSSDPEVAEVGPSGVVTTHRAGVAVVTASYLSYQAHTTIHAAQQTSSSIASVTVVPSSVGLEKGEGASLSAEVRNGVGEIVEDATVTWVSSDASVVTVEGGAVTAVNAGSATVTAASGGRSGSASVTVTDPDQDEEPEEPQEPQGDAADRFRAFPEAQGYGAAALTACDRSNVQVLRVTTTASSGTGSFADALSRTDPSRLTVITFAVAGTIEKPGAAVEKGCVYVAGQTAPGDGIQLYHPTAAALRIDRTGPTDVVLRYLRLRSGKGEPGKQDVFNIQGGTRLVVDHLSMQFGNDEVFSMETIAFRGKPITEMTIQE